MDQLARIKAGFKTIDVDPQLKERALGYLGQWLTGAEFQAYRPQLEWLIDEAQWVGLLDRFYQILPFGTGGRRGAVGIGPNRMNAWTLTASVQGHCEYLKQRFPGVQPLRVVVAYDVRRFEDIRKQYNPSLPNPVLHLSSKDLAHRAIEVYAANGIHGYVLPPDWAPDWATDRATDRATAPHFLSTPELSFTIRFHAAHGGLNLSASHNPPDDNGGKFYDERGGQPVPPDDQLMAELVDQVRTIRTMSWHDVMRSGRVTLLDNAPHQAYLDLIARQSLLGPVKPNELTVVFTPLHGVGGGTVQEVLHRQHFRVIPVAEQMTPDGLFPHVSSANPEEPKSMDRAVLLATSTTAAELILSSDPDADRIGAMIPLDAETRRRGDAESAPFAASPRLRVSPSSPEWRHLNGNEIAALVTHFKLSQLAQQGRMPSSPIVIKTLVTTGLVTRIARRFGCQVVENLLVGFKYIADVLWRLESEGRFEDVLGSPGDLIIGVEESHGYLTTPMLRDKDAAGASLLMAELALFQKRRGLGVLDYLEQLWREFGYFHNDVQPLVMTGILGRQQMTRMLDSLRAEPPTEVAGVRVTGFEDLRSEASRLGPLKGETDAANRNMLVFDLGDRARLVLRPSGTEPKAKAYVETRCGPRTPNMTRDEWQARIAGVDALAQELGGEFVRLARQRAGPA